MSDLPAPTTTAALTRRQARALEKADYLRYLKGADLSDARRYFELARLTTRQHDKGELMAGAAVGILVATLVGGGSLLVTALTAAGAFGATLILIFLIHWLRAPSSFYKQAQADLESTRLLLAEQKERNKKANLVGRILCLKPDTPSNTWVEIFGPCEYPRDCIMTLDISLTNDSEVMATAVRFESVLIWNEQTYQCTEIPIGRWFRKHVSRRPGGGPRRVEWELLKPFPLNTEITNTTHQTGWLKFFAGPIQDFSLDSAKLRLVVFDHRNEAHTIYDGPVLGPPHCGEIAEGLVEDPKPDWE